MNAPHIDIADCRLLSTARNIVLDQKIIFDNCDLIQTVLAANHHLTVHRLASSQEFRLGNAVVTTPLAAPFLAALLLGLEAG